VEAGRLAGTAQTATPPRRQPTPAAITGDGPEPDVAYDFVFDACANGQQLKCLTIIDE